MLMLVEGVVYMWEYQEAVVFLSQSVVLECSSGFEWGAQLSVYECGWGQRRNKSVLR